MSALCDPMDYSLPGSSVHRILQARVLEWVAIPFSRGSSQPGDRTPVSHIAGPEPPRKHFASIQKFLSYAVMSACSRWG